MYFDKYRLKLQKNSEKTGSSSPQFTLKYNVPRSDNPKHVSYSILSPLIGNDDVIIFLSSDFFQNTGNKDHSPINKFIENMRRLGLFVDERKRPTEQKLTFFGFASNMKKNVEVQEAAAYVPNGVWREALRDHLPMCGARYFVLNQPISVNTFMKGIFDMNEEALAGTFPTRIFDLAVVGQMGISSNVMDQAEITRRLGL